MKKQTMSISITKKNKDKIDELAKKFKISKSTLLELIIDDIDFDKIMKIMFE